MSAAKIWMSSSLMLPSVALSMSHSDSFAHLSGLQSNFFFCGFHRWQLLHGMSELVLMADRVSLELSFCYIGYEAEMLRSDSCFLEG